MTKETLGKFLVMLIGAIVLIKVYVLYVPYSISWNVTASIPTGLYFSTEYAGRALVRGEVACFPYKAPEWAKERHYFPEGFQLCKYVLGLPGDVVSAQADALTLQQVGSERKKFAYAAADSKGRQLSHAAWDAEPLKEGQYAFIAPAHTNSLDSRYLGSISKNQVTRTLVPLITW